MVWQKVIGSREPHGQFRKKAEGAGKSTKEFAEEEKCASGKTGKQARLALALMGASGAIKKTPRSDKWYGKSKD